MADLIRRDPERAASAVEMGIIDRNWLERPGEHPVRSATPVQVVQRFLERSVEQRPSVVNTVGLNTLQLLAWSGDDARDTAPSTVAVVFTDLEGFTRFTAEEGDEAALALLADHHRTVGPVVRSRGGRVVKRLGDGLMLAFPSAESAVLGATELLDCAPAPLRMRSGVHAGEAAVSRDDMVGHVVNVAARVTEQARGGEVLATTDVRDLVGELPGVHFGRARQLRLKGVGGSVAVCTVRPG